MSTIPRRRLYKYLPRSISPVSAQVEIQIHPFPQNCWNGSRFTANRSRHRFPSMKIVTFPSILPRNKLCRSRFNTVEITLERRRVSRVANAARTKERDTRACQAIYQKQILSCRRKKASVFLEKQQRSRAWKENDNKLVWNIRSRQRLKDGVW